ncbi:hypothetical protein FHR22_001696 [Sphingopyxis panaciterrae]|uniref:hypothetical protein n=1 Tax=Sphingopyxis panaciterrae TaxID=363841 RepID=UPI001423C5BD|nr:hypothetical protein [Sphingopyxis panaciterrae]NIJ37012.1 hypothetical protein [Sphingopyxis panaciterrae]
MTHIHLADRDNRRRNRTDRKPLRTVIAAGLFGWRKQDVSNDSLRKGEEPR